MKRALVLIPVIPAAAGFAVAGHHYAGFPYPLAIGAAVAAAIPFLAAWFTRPKPDTTPVLMPAETVVLMRHPHGAGFVPFAEARALNIDAIRHHGRQP